MTITPYQRRAHNGWTPVGAPAAPTTEVSPRTPYRAELGRDMTEREAALNVFAQRHPDTVFIWYERNGEYCGLRGITPDGLRVTVQTFKEETCR